MYDIDGKGFDLFEGSSISIPFTFVIDTFPVSNVHHTLKKVDCDSIPDNCVLSDGEIRFSRATVNDSGSYIISCEKDGRTGSANFYLNIKPGMEVLF